MCKNLNTSNLRTRLRKNLRSNTSSTTTRRNINLKLLFWRNIVFHLIGKTPTKISLAIVGDDKNTLSFFYAFNEPGLYAAARMSKICLSPRLEIITKTPLIGVFGN